jgi:hypothetical protein
MHGENKVKIINAQQARISYNYKNITEKLLKTNSAIWFNKICRQEQLHPNYIHINVNGPSKQSSNTKKAAIRYRLTQEIKYWVCVYVMFLATTSFNIVCKHRPSD